MSDIARFLGLGRNRNDRYCAEYQKQAGLAITNTIPKEHIPILQQVVDLCASGEMFLRDAITQAIAESGGEHQDLHAAWWEHYEWFKQEYENSRLQLTPIWNVLLAHLQVEHHIDPDRFKTLALQAATNIKSGKDIDELKTSAIADSKLYMGMPTDLSTVFPDQTAAGPTSSRDTSLALNTPTNVEVHHPGVHICGQRSEEDFVSALNHENTIAIFTLRIFGSLYARPSRGLLSKEGYLLTQSDQERIESFGCEGEYFGREEFDEAIMALRVQITSAIKEGSIPLAGGLTDLHFMDILEYGWSESFTEDQALIIEAATAFDDVTARVLKNAGAEAESFLFHLAIWHLIHQLIVPAFNEPRSVTGHLVLKTISEFQHVVTQQFASSGLDTSNTMPTNRPGSTNGRADNKNAPLPPAELTTLNATQVTAQRDPSAIPGIRASTSPVTETTSVTPNFPTAAPTVEEDLDLFRDERTPEAQHDFFLSDHHSPFVSGTELPEVADEATQLHASVSAPVQDESLSAESPEHQLAGTTPPEQADLPHGWQTYDSSTDDSPSLPGLEESPSTVSEAADSPHGWQTYDTSTEDEHALPEMQAGPDRSPSTWFHDHVPAQITKPTPNQETETHTDHGGPEETEAAAHAIPLPVMTDAPAETTPTHQLVTTDMARDVPPFSPNVAGHSAADIEIGLLLIPIDTASLSVQSDAPVVADYDASPTSVVLHDEPAPVTPEIAADLHVPASASATEPLEASESEEPTPLTVTEISERVQTLYAGTRTVLSEVGNDPTVLQHHERRAFYGQLFDLYREYMLLESEVNLPHLSEQQAAAYIRLGVRFRENLAELKP